jgi:hypothetical protein
VGSTAAAGSTAAVASTAAAGSTAAADIASLGRGSRVALALVASSAALSVAFASSAQAQATDAAAVASTVDTTGHRRLLDVEVHPIFSVPDAIGLCLEAFPMRRGLALEGCSSFQVFESASLSLNATYRLPLHTGRVLTLSLGPGLGSHTIYDSLHGPLIDVTVDVFASLEAVWWVSDRFGFQAQLGAGAMAFVWDRPEGINETVVPLVDLTLGIAFRTGGG